jgi:LmbE family N-acetylglucosaminyl deacetylase
VPRHHYPRTYRGTPFRRTISSPRRRDAGHGWINRGSLHPGSGGRCYCCNRRLRLTPRSKQYPSKRLVDLRCSEVHRAGLALGLKPDRIVFLGLPDTMAPKSGPQFDAAVEETLNVIRRSEAGALFVTWERDPHCDHEASAELAKVVRRMSPGLKLWAYPIWGWHIEASAEIRQPPPMASRIDISLYRDRKLKAIAAHASQMTDLISDDPDGFRFDESSLAPFLGQYEYFIEVPA